MNEKIKISKELAEQIKEGTKIIGNKQRFLEIHSGYVGQWTGPLSILNKLTTWELANLLINGYEIQLTPEEILLSVYKDADEKASTTPIDTEISYSSGFCYGIEFTLKKLGIKIKGIND